MRRTKRAVLVLAVISGCAPRELNVTMKSDNNSGQSGFAVVTAVGNTITVVIETSAPDFEGPQNVHIHRGNCGEVEDIFAPLENVTKFDPPKPGRVGSTSKEVRRKEDGALVKFEEFEAGDWLINIHDARENPLYVSCGEFTSK
jgi:hypothetical protein